VAVKDDRLYLIYILECLSRIELYTVEGKEAFSRDSKTQDAVLRNLQTLAESTQHLSSTLRASHREIEWEKIAGFRNVLVHNYLGINLIRVWEIVERNLPDLKARITAILDELAAGDA